MNSSSLVASFLGPEEAKVLDRLSNGGAEKTIFSIQRKDPPKIEFKEKEPTPIFMVTKGEYEDFEIVAVCTTREKAQAFIDFYGGTEAYDPIAVEQIDAFDAHIEKKEYYYKCYFSTNDVCTYVKRQEIMGSLGRNGSYPKNATTDLDELEEPYQQNQINTYKTYPLDVWATDEEDAKKKALAIIQAYKDKKAQQRQPTSPAPAPQ